MIVVAVDPGLRECGVSVWKNAQLVRAFLARNPEKSARGAKCWFPMALEVYTGVVEHLGVEYHGVHPDLLLVEYPQVYGPTHQKGDQGDLIELAAVAGAVQGIFEFVGDRDSYLPRRWKGQVPKEIHNRRVMASLTEEEKKRIDKTPANLMHNVIDGIGIGLFWHQTTGRRK